MKPLEETLATKSWRLYEGIWSRFSGRCPGPALLWKKWRTPCKRGEWMSYLSEEISLKAVEVKM